MVPLHKKSCSVKGARQVAPVTRVANRSCSIVLPSLCKEYLHADQYGNQKGDWVWGNPNPIHRRETHHEYLLYVSNSVTLSWLACLNLALAKRRGFRRQASHKISAREPMDTWFVIRAACGGASCFSQSAEQPNTKTDLRTCQACQSIRGSRQ